MGHGQDAGARGAAVNVENLVAGDMVRVRIQPGCSGEWRAHGIAPLVNGLVGRYVTDEAMGDGHRFVVEFTKDGRTWHGWFRADELEAPSGVLL